MLASAVMAGQVAAETVLKFNKQVAKFAHYPLISMIIDDRNATLLLISLEIYSFSLSLIIFFSNQNTVIVVMVIIYSKYHS